MCVNTRLQQCVSAFPLWWHYSNKVEFVTFGGSVKHFVTLFLKSAKQIILTEIKQIHFKAHLSHLTPEQNFYPWQTGRGHNSGRGGGRLTSPNLWHQPSQFIRVINREVPLFSPAANVLIDKCDLNLAPRRSAMCLTSTDDIKVSQWRLWFRLPKDKVASGWEPRLFSPLWSVGFYLVGVLFWRGQSGVCSSFWIFSLSLSLIQRGSLFLTDSTVSL